MLKITVLNTIVLIFVGIVHSYSQDFQVQLAAYGAAVPNTHFTDWGIQNVKLKLGQQNIYRYYVEGMYTREEAEKFRTEVLSKGFPYAQIIDLEVEKVLRSHTDRSHHVVSTNKEEIYLEPIYFTSGSANLDSRSRKMLKNLKTILEKNPQYSALMEGHTDSRGSAEANLELSKERVRAARDYLIETFGMNGYRLDTKVYGESAPMAVNEGSPLGRKYNRRVALLILNEKGEIVYEYTKRAKIPKSVQLKN